MGKMAYNLKNMFKSKEQREIEARMEFNQNKRAFTRYYQELDASIKNFSKMARDAELSGNHENAKACAMFVLKQQKTQVKVQGLLQRFEMMHSMQQLSGVMSKFVEACAKMGYSMDDSINLKKMWKNTAEMDKALNKLDAMSDQMDMIFETIDSGMNRSGDVIASQEENEMEADTLLANIMGRHNAVTYAEPAAVQQNDQSAAVPASMELNDQGTAGQADDTDERLRRMMEDLKS